MLRFQRARHPLRLSACEEREGAMEWLLVVFIWGAQPTVTYEHFEYQAQCQTVQAVARAAPAEAGETTKVTAYCVRTDVSLVGGVKPTILK